MKTFINKKTIKNLIIIIAIITVLSALVPNSVRAETDTEDGGGILHPIEDFVLFLCDKVMNWLQYTFVTTDNIEIEPEVWDFKYSPAIIFSGKVPAFDINFIKPNQDMTREYNDFLVVQEDNYFKDTQDDGTTNVNQATYESNMQTAMQHEGVKQITDSHSNISLGAARISNTHLIYYEETRGDNTFLCAEYFVKTTWKKEFEEITYNYKKYEYNMDEDFQDLIVVYESTAKKLQGTIATWYNALRRIALIGLLSVLVYVGIRMVTSSIAGDKAKYKSMMKDWLVAICLLFTLHYIMSITITVTNEISNIFQPGESDQLLNDLRNEIFYEGESAIALAKTIMYATLVILTVVFSIQYLKRVIFMAFYTLIAPLITLTYPLDKIKDGQAQAFTMWIREYIYTALTQVIHLVIYTVMVGSSLALVSSYPLYAIIVLAFIKKADGIIKKMFGFDKSETVGTLGAAATGALVVNALNKLAGKGGSKKGESSDSGSEAGANNVRTTSNSAMNNALESLRGGNTAAGSTPSGAKAKPSPNRLGGVTSLGGKYIKKGAGALLGAGAGATGAMLGFAAGVSQGDISAALAGAVAGGKAGKGIGQRAANGIDLSNIKNSINNLQDTWNEGAYGSEYAQNAKEIREFKSSSAYRSLKDTYGANFTDDKLSAMLQAGIKDKGDMDKVLKSSNTSDAIGYYTLAKKCPDSIYYDDDKLQMYLEDLGLSQTDASEMRKNMRNFR